MVEVAYKMPKYVAQVWALSFTAKVCSVRQDVDWCEVYSLSYGYVDNLPNLLYENPAEVALLYLEGKWF